MSPLGYLIQQCVAKPSYFMMLQAYQDYKGNTSPCRDPSIRNQCAVRMSVALGRCGFGMEGFPNQRRVHQNRLACQVAIPHVVGAQELASYLRQAWRVSQTFEGITLSNASQSLQGKHGIIYFNNCFVRTEGEGRTGDHIDLWDGSHYYNQVLGIGAGGNATTRTDLFSKADRIWFFEL